MQYESLQHFLNGIDLWKPTERIFTMQSNSESSFALDGNVTVSVDDEVVDEFEISGEIGHDGDSLLFDMEAVVVSRRLSLVADFPAEGLCKVCLEDENDMAVLNEELDKFEQDGVLADWASDPRNVLDFHCLAANAPWANQDVGLLLQEAAFKELHDSDPEKLERWLTFIAFKRVFTAPDDLNWICEKVDRPRFGSRVIFCRNGENRTIYDFKARRAFNVGEKLYESAKQILSSGVECEADLPNEIAKARKILEGMLNERLG